ncbi:MAG TPA: DNA-formamidopyrimidine glycosylase family protein [Symbiobacteriaceae bacterium]|nr:DNA-formamidopyrimidine glycosylase family protein [Symbiobacteriaceae bacterium]
MPELPEMEIYRRHLEQHCCGQAITRIEVGRPKSLNVGVRELKGALQDATLTGFSRAGKALVFHLSTGNILLNHLMLGGAIFYGTKDEAPQRTFQVTLWLEQDRALWWTGLRLGWLHLLTPAQLAAYRADLGLDPLDAHFTPAHLAALLQGRRGKLKPLLVDQQLFPGIGNCYSDEICWSAQIHPLRVAGSLQTGEVDQLWQATQTVLTEATALGGYTETRFVSGDTFTGGYLPHLKVYDRQGEPCPRCGAAIALVEASNRKVFFCPACQPEKNPDIAISARVQKSEDVTFLHADVK